MQPLLHARADAVDILQLEAEQDSGQVVLGDHDQPVRLLRSDPTLPRNTLGAMPIEQVRHSPTWSRKALSP